MKVLFSYYRENHSSAFTLFAGTAVMIAYLSQVHVALIAIPAAMITYMVISTYRSEKNLLAWDAGVANIKERYTRGEITVEEATREHRALTQQHMPRQAAAWKTSFPEDW